MPEDQVDVTQEPEEQPEATDETQQPDEQPEVAEEAQGPELELEGQDSEELLDEGEYRIDPESPLINVLASLGEIDDQLKRIKNKNIRNVGYELQFAVYPIIRSALEGILDWAVDMETSDEEAEAEEALAAGVDELREVCNKIMSLAHDEDAPHAEILGELAEWAKEKLSTLPEEEPESLTEEDLAEQRENDDE